MKDLLSRNPSFSYLVEQDIFDKGKGNNRVRTESERKMSVASSILSDDSVTMEDIGHAVGSAVGFSRVPSLQASFYKRQKGSFANTVS